MPKCELHRYHWPKAQTDESHHIIPQAWQNVWRPGSSQLKVIYWGQPPLATMAAVQLWDRRTAELCPTGHRNVHFHLVTFMKALSRGETYKVNSTEKEMAQMAIDRWREAGGKLEILWAAKLWGQA